MKPCEEFRDAVQALLDGELRADERGRVEGHLAACAACRAAAEGYRALFAALEEPRVPGPPAGFAAGVLRRVRAARRRRALWQAGLAAAAVAVAAVAALVAFWGEIEGAAELANIGAEEAVVSAWPSLAAVGEAAAVWLDEARAAAPEGLPAAAAVLVLLVLDVALAYRWRFLAAGKSVGEARSSR